MYAIVSGAIPASAHALVITSSWAIEFGAVSPIEEPSWFSADPFMIAYIWSPSSNAFA